MTENFITLADGRKIDPTSGRVVKQTTQFELPTVSVAQGLVAGVRRKMTELPSVPEKMHPIAVVLCYKLFGLNDEECALALNWSQEQVTRITQMKEYADMHQSVVESIMSGETANVRDIFTKYSRNAATKMIELMSSENETTVMMAAKDILDRAGHRPADMIVEQRSKMQADLVVKFVNDDRSTNNLPVVDVTPIKEN